MNNHEFANMELDYSQPCACGKWWWHEEHFGGDRKKAVVAFEAYARQRKGEKKDGTVSEPPKFATVEEAEAWMAEQRRVRGIPEPEERLTFASQEEADDWLRQAGEPYVPGEWAWSLTDQRPIDEIFNFAQQFMAMKIESMLGMGMQSPHDIMKGFSVD